MKRQRSPQASRKATVQPQRSRPWRWAWPSLLAAVILAVGGWFSEDLKTAFSRASTYIHDQASDLTGGRAMPWRLDFDGLTPATTPASTDPEHMVRQIYAHLGQGDRAQALATAALLASEYPTFQLGQLLYADLLNISIQKPVSWAEVNEAEQPSLMKRLNELVLESKRRLQRQSAQHLLGKVPAAFVFLSPQQPYAAVVDASQSRIYWFENRSDSTGRMQLQLIKETYISVGVNGTGKRQEGDGKTPLGVYFVQKGLPGDTLPDLFGVGALTLNYPNALDLMQKKTGSGIWLHGTPSAQYARAPESTDGCVVLSNPVMDGLMSLPGLRMTPVVIANKIDWLPSGQTSPSLADFKPTLDQWLAARNGHDPEALKLHYSTRFERDNMDLEQWWPRLAQTTLGHIVSKPLELVSVLQWQDDMHTMVVTLKDPNQKGQSQQQYLRTYWQKENSQWKLVFQGPA